MKCKISSLLDYLNFLQTQGRYTFSRKEAIETLNVSEDAFRFSALRLIKKKHLIRPTRGFYVIVPTEYLNSGAPPVTWFIDALMKFYEQPYYVGLLSAAALYGAAHQQPQTFQVITNKPLREIKIGQSLIQFFTKKKILLESCQPIKTITGFMQVSFPEMTAFDLIRYFKSSGYLSHVATVLSELKESFVEKRFKDILLTENLEPPEVQRLGYLLEIVDAKVEMIALLKQWLKERKLRSVPLRSDQPYQKDQKNKEWYLYINEKIEPDIL